MIEVEISSLGKHSFSKVSEFLLFLWDIKTLINFINLTEKSIVQLQKNPKLGKPFTKNIRKVVLHKNASMFYEFDEKKTNNQHSTMHRQQTKPKRLFKIVVIDILIN
ncbi:MAG: hypothetical protein ACK4UK_07635 [Flavobacterium sp.]